MKIEEKYKRIETLKEKIKDKGKSMELFEDLDKYKIFREICELNKQLEKENDER